jgi:YihY family inner membrane protein
MMFYLIQTFNLGDHIYDKVDERLTQAVVSIRNLTEEAGESDSEVVVEDVVGDVVVHVPAVVLNEPVSEGEFVLSEGEIVGEGVVEGHANEKIVAEGERLEEEGEAVVTEASVIVVDRPKRRPEESDARLKQELIGWVFPIFNEEQSITNDPAYENPVKLLVRFAEQGAGSPHAIGVSGLLFILSTVFGFMRNVEYTFNKIWGVSQQRNPLRVISHYMMITLLLPFVAAVIMGISAALESQYVVDILGPFAIGLRGTQFLILCLTFTLMYLFIPNTKVYFRYALLGGIIGAALYMLNSWSYVKFQTGLARYTLFFSTFALFPITLMYIYFSWLILLFGSLVSFAYQNEKTFAMERLADHATFAYREALAVRLMIELARRFRRGDYPMTVKEAAENWNVPTRLVSEAIDSLIAAKLMAACATTPVCYQPARSPQSIKVIDIINAVRESGQDPSLFRQDKDYSHLYAGIDTASPAVMNSDIHKLSENVTIKL